MFGNFKENTCGYEINTINLPSSWEFIYENRDILLKVDQYGPVYAQAHPPGDIMLFKREQHYKFSPWFINITSDAFNERITNFFRPNDLPAGIEPTNVKIEYLPECAVYSFEYKGFRFTTEFIIPKSGITVAMKFRVKNTGSQKASLTIAPQFLPYANEASIALWDKYEWYLDNTCSKGEHLIFRSEILNAEVKDSNKRRSLRYALPVENLTGYELSLEKYIGFGTASHPERYYTNDNHIFGYPPVYAASYNWTLEATEERELTAILTLDQIENELKYFDTSYFEAKKLERKQQFDQLFAKNTIKTGDEVFDNYVKYWLPLQMQWVASLDRGWPTGMRGSRDSAQDYTALLFIDKKNPRDIILAMCECQRTDGWFPRQYSSNGKHGKHDLRTYVDGGAFFLEFMWQYLAHTGDYAVLEQETEWLDSDKKNTIKEHLIAAAEYYIKEENLGEHGLCKIRGGDWLDGINGAGLDGRGESVTVSAQIVMGMKYLADILKKLDPSAEVSRYLEMADILKENINRHAFNKLGYYNSVFNDAGAWIFSDLDPDGEHRIYGVSNYYPIIAGVAKEDKFRSIFENVERLKCDMGYRLFWPYLGEKPMEKVGRLASGDAPPFMVENGNVYNHGSQGFFARALAVAGLGDKLFEVLKWLMPYDTEKHPTELAYTPPYAIVNCWQQLPGFHHRALFCFLTGSVAMAVRGVYEWMMGIQPTLDGLELAPCLPSDMKTAEADFEYMGKTHNLKIEGDKVYFDGSLVTKKRRNLITGNEVWFVQK